MARDFLERIRDSVWWLEQSAHFNMGDLAGTVAGLTVFWAVPSSPGLWAGVSAIVGGALVGAIRESVQNIGDRENDVPDAVADAVFVTLGGARASAVFFAIWAVS